MTVVVVILPYANLHGDGGRGPRLASFVVSDMIVPCSVRALVCGGLLTPPTLPCRACLLLSCRVLCDVWRGVFCRRCLRRVCVRHAHDSAASFCFVVV